MGQGRSVATYKPDAKVLSIIQDLEGRNPPHVYVIRSGGGRHLNFHGLNDAEKNYLATLLRFRETLMIVSLDIQNDPQLIVVSSDVCPSFFVIEKQINGQKGIVWTNKELFSRLHVVCSKHPSGGQQARLIVDGSMTMLYGSTVSYANYQPSAAAIRDAYYENLAIGNNWNNQPPPPEQPRQNQRSAVEMDALAERIARG
jgi:hypothetical protein